ncbi:hypothetical protein GGR54DRAFT_388155 [Hypoxylon sp. NC1633]|nr:hypothetical protein GGR54DRAFT_388155 [Hypoxylon sp. NC1633]
MSSQQNQSKITSKNLSYSTDLPPFLARLRGQHQQQHDSDSPDPILAARRRAARPRSASEEADDSPLVVDEAGNTVAFPGTEVPLDTKDGEPSSEKDEAQKEEKAEKVKVAGIGAGKKRKVGRVIGGDKDGEGGRDTKAISKLREEIQAKTMAKDNDHGAAAKVDSNDGKSTAKPGRKKAKKIKLSFGDDAE